MEKEICHLFKLNLASLIRIRIFLGEAIVSPEAHAGVITWKSDAPVWVNQWPLTKEKILAAEQLVQEQLALGHNEHSNSPWNSPIFIIKKKSGKWRLLQDLRKVNETGTYTPWNITQPLKRIHLNQF